MSEVWKSAKTRNLSAQQMRQAKRIVGKKRTEKVTGLELFGAAKPVDIGTTKWLEAKDRGGKGRGGLLVNQSGQAVTGTVKLPSGQSAMYVRGKRIGVARGAASTSRGNDTSTGRKRVGPMSSSSAEALRRARNQDRRTGSGAGSVAPSVAARQGKFGSMTLPGGAAGRIPRTRGQISSNSEMRAVMEVPQPRRESGKPKKPIMYANGTASVYDPKLGRRVTVGRSDPRHPKYRGK
jgi:hypothetical protein